MKKIISFLLTLGVISSYTVHAEKADMVEIYVDCKVTESGDGSADMPYKTIDEAKNYIRTLKSEGEYPEGGVKVWIREGNYKVDKAITFTAEDSGVDGAPVIYQAWEKHLIKKSIQ